MRETLKARFFILILFFCYTILANGSNKSLLSSFSYTNEPNQYFLQDRLSSSIDSTQTKTQSLSTEQSDNKQALIDEYVQSYLNKDLIPVTFEINTVDYDNTSNLDKIINTLMLLIKDEQIQLEHIWFGIASSMDGNEIKNIKLSKERCIKTVEYLSQKTGLPKNQIKGEVLGEDWTHMLYLLEKSHPEYYSKVKKIKETYPINDRREAEIKKDPQLWEYLVTKILPHCRYVKILIVGTNKEGQAVSIYPTADQLKLQAIVPVERMSEPKLLSSSDLAPTLAKPSPILAQEETVEESKAPFNIALKTNLLNYSLLAANLGFELGADHWSLDLPVCYSPYDLFSHTTKARFLMTQPELRYWFKEYHRSHFIGLHGTVAGYNIAFPNKDRYQDARVPAWGVGLGWGMAIPFKKNENWGIEFNLGLGFIRHKTNIFHNAYNGLQKGYDEGWYFGPTRVGVSLYYNFDIK